MAEEILSKNGLKQYRLSIIENGKEESFAFIDEKGFDSLYEQAQRLANNLDSKEKELENTQGALCQREQDLEEQKRQTQATKEQLSQTQHTLGQTKEQLESTQGTLAQTQSTLQAKEQELETLRKDFGQDLLELFTTLPQNFRASLNITESNPAFILGIRDKLPIVHKKISEIAQKAYKNGQSLESPDFQNLLDFIEKLCAFLCQADFEYERIETKEGERFDTAKHIAVNDKVSGTIDKVLLQGFKKGDTLKSLITIKE